MLQQQNVFYVYRLQYHDGSDGSDGLGTGATSLNVGLRFSLQPSFESQPNSPLMTGLVGLIKARSPSTSNNQTHATCNAILTRTGLRVGFKSLHCRVGLLFYCFS